MGSNFEIKMDDKPALSNLMKTDVSAFKDIVSTFVNLMEVAAEKKWHKLPDTIHTSLSFNDLISGILNAIMTTREIDETAFSALEKDLHPLSLLSDKRKNLVSGESETYDWRKHFALDSNEISKETIENIIRKILYLVRWFDIESISKALITQQFPVVDAKDIQKLPFQPALQYQEEHLGELFIGKFFHDIGALNCGEIDKETTFCPACRIGQLQNTIEETIAVCPRCNSGFKIKAELEF